MKIPQAPPPQAELTEEIVKNRQDWLEILDQLRLGPLVNGQYLHWSELVHRPAPNKLTHREWWWAVKHHRLTNSQSLPLRDKSGLAFRYTLVDPIPERLHQIDLSAGGKIEIADQAALTNQETRDRYYINSLIEEAITSSQLEGAVATRLVAKEMIRQGREPHDTSERMILNNYLTMHYLGEIKRQPLTPELVFDIHRRITEKTLNDESQVGRCRRANEPVDVADQYGEVVHVPPAAEQLPERLAMMCDFANGLIPTSHFIHPVIRSIILHFWLAYDHPFVDGNGRTARALFYWSMTRHGYWLFEFISISRMILKAPIQYVRSFLFSETDEGDLTYFLLAQIDVIHRAIQELESYLARKIREIKSLENLLRGQVLLNHRQQALISHALRHPGHRYTVYSHQTSHQISYETARSDLFDLHRKCLLDVSKIGKKYIFTPIKDLEEKLATISS